MDPVDESVSRRLQPVAPAPTRTGSAVRPILFVGGLHRSGTSVVHRTIAAHPDVAAMCDTGAPEDEGQHLQDVYPPAYRHGGPGSFAFDPAAHLTEASPLATTASREALLRQWGRHWDPEKPVAVEKSPPNLIRTRFLQAVFPEAVFVLVVRHPVAVVEATSKWRRTATRTSLVHHWAAAHRLMLADLPYLRRVQLVRYEEFVADPDRRLAQIFALVGLDPVPAGEPVRTGINERYFAGWEARARWPHGRLDRAVAVRRHEADARRLGYSLRDPRATIRDVEA